MKPREILSKYGLDKLPSWRDGQADTLVLILKYIADECVIAYLMEEIGFCFIIKGIKKHFAFYGVKKGIYLGGLGYIFRRCSLKEAVKILDRGGVVLNKKEYNKIKDLEMLKSLGEEN